LSKRKPSSRANGRPRHEPTAHSRELVRTLYLAGWRQDRIAVTLRLDPKTLRLRYKPDLANEPARAAIRSAAARVRAKATWAARKARAG